MNSNNINLHVFVIGAASKDKIPGQLPSIEHVKLFSSKYPEYNTHYYFIDPMHIASEIDVKIFDEYCAENISYTFIPIYFDLTSFDKRYKVLPGEEALFIDYADVTESEYDFVSKLGTNPKWYYYTHGLFGPPKLNILDAYNIAKNIPHFNIHSLGPVPTHLSYFYRQNMMKDINKLIICIDLLPANKEKKAPPDWMLLTSDLTKGMDIDTIVEYRKSAYDMLSEFFKKNNKQLSNYKQKDYYIMAQAVMGILRVYDQF